MSLILSGGRIATSGGGLWNSPGSAQTFDYYISPTGSDGNAGTLASPWAITSLRNASPNNALIARKRVGLLPGTYNIPGTMTSSHPSDYSYPVLSLPWGSSSASTYLGTSNSSGNYSPRTALIQYTDAGAGFGNIGAGLFGTEVCSSSSQGYVTIDGLIIDAGGNVYDGHIIQFWSDIGESGGDYQKDAVTAPVGIVVQNCELRNMNITAPPGNNEAAIYSRGTNGSIFQNNYIHDITKPGQPDHCHAYEEYASRNVQFIYNTVARCTASIESKGGSSGTVVAYNYVTAPQWIAIIGFDGATGQPNNPSTSYYIHHNVFDTCKGGDSPSALIITDQAPNYTLYQDISVYNNTVYEPSSGSYQIWHLNQDASSIGTTTFHDNLTVINATGSGGGLHPGNGVNVTSGKFSGLDYNGYSIATFALGLDGSTYSTLSAWQTATGGDAHAVIGSPNFASTIFSGNGPVQFQLASGSPYKGTGTGGANIGAWDGTVTQIGCNFSPTPP